MDNIFRSYREGLVFELGNIIRVHFLLVLLKTKLR